METKTISEREGEKIFFIQPSFFKRYYELKSNEELLATLQQKGFFGMTWNVSIGNKNWEIYKPSIWRTGYAVRPAGYDMPIAEFKRDGLRDRGTVQLQRGERIKIIPHLFKGFTEITSEGEEQFVRIKSKTSLRDKAEVFITKKSEIIDNNPWLVVLAYIISIEQRHRASHST